MQVCRSERVIFMDHVVFTYRQLTSASDVHIGRGAENERGREQRCEHQAVICENLSVSAGQALAVMGASGSGKSTLCHILAGLAPRYTGGKIQGGVRVAGHDVIADVPTVGDVGLLFQDAATQLFNPTVEDEVAWGLEAMALPPDQIGARVHEALAYFGLLGLERRTPWTLSGGEQKRLALATLWAMQPRVLLLDEPLGGLDPAGREEVLTALSQVRQAGTTLLWTTLRPRLAELADEVALLEEGRLTSPMTAPDILDQESRLVQAGILYPQSQWPHFVKRPPQDAAAAVEVRDLSFGYPEGDVVLHHLDLTISQGEFLALIGPNGAGKTTLVRHLNGLLRPTSGVVRVLGKEVGQRPVGDLAKEVGFLFQRPEQQIFGTTVRDEVAYGPKKLQMPDWEERAARALDRFDLTELAEVPPAVLSYGMQRSVTLAALTALDTPIIVLDEPTVGLDGHGWAQFLPWLAERHAAGVTIIVVTHELALASCADRIVEMREGHIIHNRVVQAASDVIRDGVFMDDLSLVP